MLENLEKTIRDLKNHLISMEMLDLQNQKIDSETVKQIAEVLEKDAFLESVDLGFNPITGTDAQTIAEALKQNKYLKQIIFDQNTIGDEGAKAFAEMLKVNKFLKSLYIIGNNISAEGAQAIAEALLENSSLEELWISCNEIGDKGAQAIAKALKKNTSLKSIHMNSCGIGEVGETALVESLKKNTSLTTLVLEDNNCNHCENISKYLERNKKLNYPMPAATKEQAEQVRKEILKLFATPEGQSFASTFATSCWGDSLRMESVLMVEKAKDTEGYCLKIADDCFEQSFFIDARYAYAETKTKPLLLDYEKKHMDDCYYPDALKKLESVIHGKWNDTTQRTSRIWRERKNCDVGYTYSLEISPQNVKRIFVELSSTHQSSVSTTVSSAVVSEQKGTTLVGRPVVFTQNDKKNARPAPAHSAILEKELQKRSNKNQSFSSPTLSQTKIVENEISLLDKMRSDYQNACRAKQMLIDATFKIIKYREMKSVTGLRKDLEDYLVVRKNAEGQFELHFDNLADVQKSTVIEAAENGKAEHNRVGRFVGLDGLRNDLGRFLQDVFGVTVNFYEYTEEHLKIKIHPDLCIFKFTISPDQVKKILQTKSVAAESLDELLLRENVKSDAALNLRVLSHTVTQNPFFEPNTICNLTFCGISNENSMTIEEELRELKNLGVVLKEEGEKAFKEALNLAKQGDAKKQFRVAKYYSQCAKSFSDNSLQKLVLELRAVKYYQLAASQGYARAQNNLAELGQAAVTTASVTSTAAMSSSPVTSYSSPISQAIPSNPSSGLATNAVASAATSTMTTNQFT